MYAAKIRAAENRSPNIKPTIPPENTENKSIYHVSNSNKLVHCTREREREYQFHVLQSFQIHFLNHRSQRGVEFGFLVRFL